MSIDGRESRQIPPPQVFRVLVVDDETVIADTLAMIFSAAGYLVCAAYSGEEALALSTEFSPDVVIADVILGGMNGMDLVIALQALFPLCKSVLISGATASADLLSAYEQAGHCFEILPKPTPPPDLLALVADLARCLPYSGRTEGAEIVPGGSPQGEDDQKFPDPC